MSSPAGGSTDRVFLDANVLFSAAWRETAGLRKLWRLDEVELVTSAYALEEARRNLGSGEQRTRLNRLVAGLEVVPEATDHALPDDVDLPEKDRPILRAALAAGATHLLTGDVTDFGALFGREVGDLRIERPASYLRGRSEKG